MTGAAADDGGSSAADSRAEREALDQRVNDLEKLMEKLRSRIKPGREVRSNAKVRSPSSRSGASRSSPIRNSSPTRNSSIRNSSPIRNASSIRTRSPSKEPRPSFRPAGTRPYMGGFGELQPLPELRSRSPFKGESPLQRLMRASSFADDEESSPRKLRPSQAGSGPGTPRTPRTPRTPGSPCKGEPTRGYWKPKSPTKKDSRPTSPCKGSRPWSPSKGDRPPTSPTKAGRPRSPSKGDRPPTSPKAGRPTSPSKGDRRCKSPTKADRRQDPAANGWDPPPRPRRQEDDVPRSSEEVPRPHPLHTWAQPAADPP
eukprot:Hpha_TRINITY_DN11113_c0_g1::TRINITY_DN11113_c0_g1_i1::g.28244::m.28244